MNNGVSASPCASASTPHRAAPSRCVISNFIDAACSWAHLINQHRVTVTEKAIPLLDRMSVGAADGLEPCERRHEHEQGRFRQVEISEQPVDDAEIIARRDEQLRFPGTGCDLTGAPC